MATKRAHAALGAFLSEAEELHASMGKPDAARMDELVERMLRADEHLQAAVIAAFEDCEARKRAEHLNTHAAERQAELVALATRMHKAGLRLADAQTRSMEAFAATESAQSSTRHVPLATLVEYAERASYSIAAPVGEVALEGAHQQGWFHGWGAPAPQQHMLANATFATGRPAAKGGKLPASDAEMAVLESDQPDTPFLATPAFTTVAPQPAAPASQQRRPVLGFDDDDDDDDEFD